MFDRSCREFLNLVSTFLSDDKKADWDTSMFLKNKRKLVEWKFYFNESEKYKVINNWNHYKDKSLLFWCPLWILITGIFIFIFTRILSIDLLKLQEKDFITPLYTCNFNYTQTKPNVCFDKIVSSRFRYGRPLYVLSHTASEIHVVLAPFCFAPS